ncbi:MAG: hypothetical protein WC236_13690 [Gallionellaceae bacterium]|jgi:hypothetical protein
MTKSEIQEEIAELEECIQINEDNMRNLNPGCAQHAQQWEIRKRNIESLNQLKMECA